MPTESMTPAEARDYLRSALDTASGHVLIAELRGGTTIDRDQLEFEMSDEEVVALARGVLQLFQVRYPSLF